jgi:hypothetical protein
MPSGKKQFHPSEIAGLTIFNELATAKQEPVAS